MTKGIKSNTESQETNYLTAKTPIEIQLFS